MSDDVDATKFLKHIRQLSEQRDQEDAERVKKLEEEIIQGRNERLARRAERARSLSPDKPTTPQSQGSMGASRDVQEKATETPTPVMDLPSQDSARQESLNRLTGSPAQRLEDFEPKKPAPSPAALTRSNTVLGWQQRRSGPRRPLSMAAPSSTKPTIDSPSETPESGSPAAPTLSRDQIAQSLGGKDPSWFRQTADRGIGSAAYRKNQEDNLSEVGSVSGRRQLPGMSREGSAEPQATSPPPENIRSSSPSRLGSIRGSATWNSRFSTSASVSGEDTELAGKSKTPSLLESIKFDPPTHRVSSIEGGDQANGARSLAMSPTQGRMSPERVDRSPSPTKGMGGFVQSAMLKRSDSVNKRWSTQNTPLSPGLSRQNSTVSNLGGARTGFSGVVSTSKPERPTSLSRETSMEPPSRPSSSSSNLTITTGIEGLQRGEFARPALPHSRTRSVTSISGERPMLESSPSRDSKRWSPTKATWIESALKRPESPKPKAAAPEQPSWMTEINRIKQQRGSVDLGKGNPLMSPPADSPRSGRSSPIKEDQKPNIPREASIPEKEEYKEETQSPVVPTASLPAEWVMSSKEEGVPSLEPTASPELEEVPDKQLSKDPVSLPPAKPKPRTPPKKDFRAALRSRQTPTETSTTPKKDDVPEFQNVFGKLKKAQTQKYVAPDVLTANILRGKAALNETGGPKPSNRKDEFRQSLIEQKEAMLAKAQETGSAAHKRTDSSSQQATPEAIALREKLGRTGSISTPAEEKQATPEAISRRKSLRAAPKPSPTEKSAQPDPGSARRESVRSSKLADRFNPVLAGMLARGPPPMTLNSGASKSVDVSENVHSPDEEKKGSAPELKHMTKGRARGPKRRAPTTKQAAPTEKPATSKAPVAVVPLVKTEEVLSSNAPSEVLSSNAPSEVQSLDRRSGSPALSDTPARQSLKAKPVTPAKSPDLSKRMSKSPSPEVPRKPSLTELEKKRSFSGNADKKPMNSDVIESPVAKPPAPQVASWRTARPLPSPPEAEKKVETPSRFEVKSPMSERPSKTTREIAQETAQKATQKATSETTQGHTKETTRETPEPEVAGFSVKKVTSLWGRQAASSPPPRVKSPIKLPTRADERAAMENAGLVEATETAKPAPPKPQSPKPIGLGLGGFGGYFAGRATRESSPPKPLSTNAFPASPPSSGRPQSEPFASSPKPAGSDELFAEYFDEPPVITGELPKEIDTLQMLTSSPLDLGPASKIRTLRKQMQEITSDGQLSPVPMQEEHVLFQESMYLCTHVFGDAKGARHTEVYLWAGSGVPEPTLEDTQHFARNIAKQNQGKLIVLRQGKETPNFCEALGGIVITRRGGRPAARQYMLCGRRHLGHLTFDEVDYSLNSLCSGFPYIVSSPTDKIFLWKGRGCSAEEVSGARLMGMDLTTTGELIEMDEASELPEFFNAFTADTSDGMKTIPRSADYWRYKASSEKYRTRLFKLEQQQSPSGWGQSLQVSSFLAPLLRRPSWHSFHSADDIRNGKPTERSSQQPSTPNTPSSPEKTVTVRVTEIVPFCQGDLEPEFVYVLDAFFEMYIIIGPLSRTQSASFSTALLFAQEYGLLAASEESRPMIPVATVVLDGTPRDMKAAFRCWSDERVSAAGLIKGKLGRGKSLRILGVERAIKEATRRGREGRKEIGRV
ncbi:hypothetical protein GQ43DRAFT_374455 [Delitschia confertaspora ATCC 74209]|uniref:DUF4045 domain-containing protein n=1 Tax=Delitschia confertaspora ATCC 74209 TaxID=1513339 RepID=A0A9P4MR99_9PLEO|nr:hypothetical protein GQ43DRAFT_374455 [Delitschia confertaspora ATCC 74209]